jgi:hypothetical protein
MLITTNTAFYEPVSLYPYNNDLVDTSQEISFAPYKDDSDLGLKQTYQFIGYSSDSDDVNRERITSPVPDIIIEDIDIYAIFKEESIFSENYISYCK